MMMASTCLPFMFDRTLFEKAKVDFDKMAADRITIEETYTAQVLASKDGLVFNVEEELKSGNAYAKLWKTTGLKNMYGLPLRVGNKDIGTIWLLANRLSQLLLKGICAQISIAIANIQANEKLLAYKKQLEVENDYLKEQIKTIYNFSEIIGSGDADAKSISPDVTGSRIQYHRVGIGRNRYRQGTDRKGYS